MTSPWSNPPAVEAIQQPVESAVVALTFVHPMDYDRLREHMIKVIDHLPAHIPHNPEIYGLIKKHQEKFLDIVQPDQNVPIGRVRFFETEYAKEFGDFKEHALTEIWLGLENPKGLCTDVFRMLHGLFGSSLIVDVD